MGSWRDSASEQAQEDLDGLTDVCLRFASQTLDTRSSLLPFGAMVGMEGETTLIGVDVPDGKPDAADMVATIVSRLREQRNQIRASAVVADVRAERSDAVRVELEHVDGHVIQVLLPYEKKRRRGVEYGALTASSGQAQIWA